MYQYTVQSEMTGKLLGDVQGVKATVSEVAGTLTYRLDLEGVVGLPEDLAETIDQNLQRSGGVIAVLHLDSTPPLRVTVEAVQ